MAEEKIPAPTIEWPTLKIPGRGEFKIRFGFKVTHYLLREHGLDELAIGQKFATMFPHRDESGEMMAGSANRCFLIELLQLCLKGQCEITEQELVDAFDSLDEPPMQTWGRIAEAMATAYSKSLRLSQNSPLPAIAASQEKPAIQ